MSENCLNCEDRKLGCHDSCSTYAEFKKSRQEILKKQRQYMDGRGYDSCLAPKCGKVKRYDQARFKY